MRTFTFLCCMLLTAASLQAQIIHVPGDYITIQQGINAANPGDTVLVGEGTYNEQIKFLGKKPLMVASHFLIDGDTMHISRTVITKNSFTNMDSASIVYFISGEDTTSVLCGFTITGGRGTNIINPLWRDREGGGIWISGSGAMIRNNIIIKNRCEGFSFPAGKGTGGGGISIDTEQEDHWVVIQDNMIDSNTVISNLDTNWNDGGGICAGNNCRIINNIITNNLSKSLVNTNENYYSHGGILVFADTSWNKQVFVQNNLIQGNSVNCNYSFGGGIVISGVKLYCSNNTIKANRAESAISISNLGGGGMGAQSLKEGSVIRNNIFEGNTSESWSGGLNISEGTTTLLVENNSFFGNHANGSGGALGVVNIPVVFQNNLFRDNSAHNDGVGYLESSTVQTEHSIFFVNNTFIHNTVADLCGALDATATHPLIFNCIFWEDSAFSPDELWASSGGQFEIAYSDIDTNDIGGSRVIGPGIFHADPLFEDTFNLVPYHWSPCIDAGVNEYTCSHGNTYQAPAYDFSNTHRPVGAGYDMGAYDQQYWAVGMRNISHDESGISIYPNPATDQITIKTQDKGQIVIMNSTSGQLLQKIITGQITRIDVSRFPDGLYIVKKIGENGIRVGKFIKQ